MPRNVIYCLIVASIHEGNDTDGQGPCRCTGQQARSIGSSPRQRGTPPPPRRLSRRPPQERKIEDQGRPSRPLSPNNIIQPSRTHQAQRLGRQSSRETFSFRSWHSWASRVIVAIGRASNRPIEIGSPETSQ